MITAGVSRKELFQYEPNLIKKSIVGKGKAGKDQVKFMVKQILPKSDVSNEHATDALAVAICHSNHMNLKEY